MKLKTFINCKILKTHNWTCKAQENIKPTQEQLKKENIVNSFWDYAMMYCKDCGTVSELSKQMICKYKNSDSNLEK